MTPLRPLLAAGDIGRIEPHRREPIPPIGNAHMYELPAPAGNLGLDELLAVPASVPPATKTFSLAAAQA
jgi:hypothetical protein